MGVAVGLAATDHLSWLWALPGAAAFLAALARFGRAHDARRRAERAIEFYERGLARLDGEFAGRGDGGERFLPPDHPYAEHLDLFGRGSLFELLSMARSRAGKRTLAGWLCAPAPPDEVRARQEAVRELAPRLDLREELIAQESIVTRALDSARPVAWGEAEALFEWRHRLIALLQVATTVVLAGFWAAGFSPLPFFVAALVQGGYARLLRDRVRNARERAEGPAAELALVAPLLARLEREAVNAPRLAALQARWSADGRTASACLRDLRRRIELRDWQGNQFFAPFSLFLLWGTLTTLRIERWRERFGPRLAEWLAAVGEFEALLDLAGHGYEHPDRPFAELTTDGPLLEGEAMVHPFVPASRAVANDLRLDPDLRLLVVTGSNMSGKSTFLRTTGLAAVLAQAGAPVPARSLRLSPLQVVASIRTIDSLLDGASRFYAEITLLRRAVEAAEREPPVLFLLDEMLHGTNSHDRRVGATGVVEGLLARGSIGLVTTHDLALAQLADDLAPKAANTHFDCRLEEGRLRFDYRLRPGVVERTNALELMRAMGLLDQVESDSEQQPVDP